MLKLVSFESCGPAFVHVCVLAKHSYPVAMTGSNTFIGKATANYCNWFRAWDFFFQATSTASVTELNLQWNILYNQLKRTLNKCSNCCLLHFITHTIYFLWVCSVVVDQKLHTLLASCPCCMVESSSPALQVESITRRIYIMIIVVTHAF